MTSEIVIKEILMIKTSIAERLESAGLGALCEDAEKRLVSHKSWVAWILKAAYREKAFTKRRITIRWRWC